MTRQELARRLGYGADSLLDLGLTFKFCSAAGNDDHSRGNTVWALPPSRKDRGRRHGRGVSRAGYAVRTRGGPEAGLGKLPGPGQRVRFARRHTALARHTRASNAPFWNAFFPRTLSARSAFRSHAEPSQRMRDP